MSKVHAYVNDNFSLNMKHDTGDFKIKFEGMSALDMSRQFKKVSDYFKNISRDKFVTGLKLTVKGEK